MAIRRIGQILVDLGYINDDQLAALVEDQQQDVLLGREAIERSLITEEQLQIALAEQFGMQTFTVGDTAIPSQVIALITIEKAQLYGVIPISLDKEANRLTIATCEPQKILIQDELRMLLGYDIHVVVLTDTNLQQSLDRFYPEGTDFFEALYSYANTKEPTANTSRIDLDL